MAVQHANPSIDGRRIRALRQEAGLTVTEAARRIGVTTSYLSAIELGRRPTVAPARYIRICQVLGVSREEIERKQPTEAAA